MFINITSFWLTLLENSDLATAENRRQLGEIPSQTCVMTDFATQTNPSK